MPRKPISDTASSRELKFTTSTGVTLEQTSMSKNMDSLAKQKGVQVRAFVATHPNGNKEYVLLEGREPIYSAQSAEAIFCHIEIMAMQGQYGVVNAP